MFDELFKSEEDKDAKPENENNTTPIDEDDDTTPDEEEQAYEEGRTGEVDIIRAVIATADKPKEAAARQRGTEARIDADQTKKENSEDED